MKHTQFTRRQFAATIAAASLTTGRAEEIRRPNILWVTTEDIGQEIGPYGDRYANTPNLDRLAAKGIKFRNAWSNAPVCAAARTSIITGMYPTCEGAEHMRSMTHLAPGQKLFPCYLREAGYYTSNNSKEDYNVEHTGTVWDESSSQAHWRKRTPGQPFFSVFNILTTHESQIIKRPHTLVHDPAGVRVPAYHPDTPEVRRDWAQYYDNITTMDGQAAAILAQLEKDGLADDTIVFFYGDHGAGMPRSKRFPYDSGLRVPLIVHIPEKFKHLAPADYRAGGTSDRMVAFVDLGPTVLSLAGVKPPTHMQGSAFLGRHIATPRPFNYGFRGRMDERYDLMRSVTDGRYVYIRNYMPHRIYGQHVGTMFQTPTTQVWKRLYDEGKLNAAQKHFWEVKPTEELYDRNVDRDEVNNLSASAGHRPILEKLRNANEQHIRKIRDIGFLPEGELHTRSLKSSPYEVGHDETRYPMERVISTAEMASARNPKKVTMLLERLADSDSAVRYWAASGLLMLGADGFQRGAAGLRTALKDKGPYVRAVAAESLARYGTPDDISSALDTLADLVPADKNGGYVSLWALITIDDLGKRAEPIWAKIRGMSVLDESAAERAQGYAGRVMAKLRADHGEASDNRKAGKEAP
jgi:uncharacterized sulfatase